MLLPLGKGAVQVLTGVDICMLLLIMPLNSLLFLKGDQRRAILHQSLVLSHCCCVLYTSSIESQTLPECIWRLFKNLSYTSE